jgi:hypothetical protein
MEGKKIFGLYAPQKLYLRLKRQTLDEMIQTAFGVALGFGVENGRSSSPSSTNITLTNENPCI